MIGKNGVPELHNAEPLLSVPAILQLKSPSGKPCHHSARRCWVIRWAPGR